jgi:riboflavin kinase/FMN adenylyltransferase
VYVTQLRVGGEWFDAVTNVGNRPTFGADSFAVESHLLDFHPISLEEQTPLRLLFHRRLREERRWPSPEALKEQIMLDVAQAKRYLHLMRLLGRNGS